MGDFVDRASSILERRFLKNAFLPVLLLPGAIVAPWALQADRPRKIATAWAAQQTSIQIVQGALAVALIWFGAAVVASQWRNIIQLFEGYPLMRVPRIGKACADWYWRRAGELDAAGEVAALYYYYPGTKEDCLPTRLGNVLRAAERYPYYRYGADTIVVWPRLYHLLDRQVVDDVEDSRATLEFLLVVSLWFALAGAGGGCVLLATGSSAAWAVVWFLGSVLAAYLMYVSAIRAAVEYGEQLRACIELYRLRLFEQLRIAEPMNLKLEKQAWTRLTDLVQAGSVDAEAAYAPRSAPAQPGGASALGS